MTLWWIPADSLRVCEAFCRQNEDRVRIGNPLPAEITGLLRNLTFAVSSEEQHRTHNNASHRLRCIYHFSLKPRCVVVARGLLVLYCDHNGHMLTSEHDLRQYVNFPGAHGRV